MDDDVCEKSGLAKTGGCVCASTPGSVKCTEWPSDQTAHVCREYTQIGNSFNCQKSTDLIKCCGQVKKSRSELKLIILVILSKIYEK